MNENLVIVESPAKAKTIEKFLGDKYKVLSSYGHIRDLKKRSFSVDEKTFAPQYEVPSDKTRVVDQLKKQAEQAQMVWLASDEDREGEAISWHLYEVLGLKPENTRRIVFHEITKPAILDAIEHPRQIDLNLVNAQQARRVLDRIVGFKLSPVLWRKVKPSLSAGRVQSVAVRLIVEREREIQNFKSEENYRVTALFHNSDGSDVKAVLGRRFPTADEAKAFLESLKSSKFTVQDIQTKPIKRSPAPPFTTSTLQQEAAHKLGFTVAQTMMIAQHLYESGRITYMRTDSVNLSKLCLGASKKVIEEQMGKDYVKTRQYHTSSKGAQEAHEAIRPTYMDQQTIEGNQQERRLYDLIWKRTIASQMADAELEHTMVTININGKEETFVAEGEVVKFDGFLRIYSDANGEINLESDGDNENLSTLPAMTVGESLSREQIVATQRFSQRPIRYNEASLVRKLEELGIGRPSTYATTITTIQQREYVEKGDKPGEERTYQTITLKGDKVTQNSHTTIVGQERGKLLPTDTGIVVNDFLIENFPEIMDYNFTADIEKEFDEIAEGKMAWEGVVKNFYEGFEPLVEKSVNTHTEHKVGERLLGKDPVTGATVTVKIGRFGPVAQMGNNEDGQKPRFAQLNAGQKLETITLEEALELFQLPRKLGTYEGEPITIGAGKFGPYVSHKGSYVSIPKDIDPMEITFEQAVIMMHRKHQEEAERHMKTFEEDAELEVLNGRYGPYITYKGNNYRLPKNMHERAKDLTYEECMQIIESQNEKPAPRRRFTRK
ncbi:MAG: type I DNA topoisomerase [Bacteroidaceae bacterium]|jgi:DNA topoisomerase-1|nr:type I DNA topoisomerase [Bacteroidaceae bacterium]